ncbi:MAG TPA: hypothetical protein VMD30_13960, partial [Tepidisphaeraceae bacterium]|nr:hypothetical protein [Tepidisphaeraceae bacterium]
MSTSHPSLYALVGVPIFDYCFPARKGITPYYSDTEQLGEAIEAVANTQSNAAQVTLLTKDACSTVPYISRWAVEALGQIDLPKLIQISHDAKAIQGLPLSGQVSLDNVLCESSPTWSLSLERRNMLHAWIPRAERETDYWLLDSGTIAGR